MFISGVVATVLVICLTAQLSLAGPSEWGQDYRDYILDIHNDRRRNEGGCQINKLVYDQELEKQARSWAERCVFKHESIKGRGENLAWNSNHYPEMELIKNAADSWFNEKNRYSYGQRSCGSSGACHYTQMVWADTQRVGCYTTRCANLQYAYRDAWYLVCFYTPVGNWNGEKPYQKSCATPCLEGQTEENGLCVGEGKKVVICENKSPSCESWAKTGQCQANPGYMKLNCNKACKEC